METPCKQGFKILKLVRGWLFVLAKNFKHDGKRMY